ncbi:hypothetical protein [Actinomadura rugatobispora]|uniref:NPCBM-associated, NEW3 domain of alpha-galactosidase n=1 Tax=Actinomadura rugatobispora TaxID=1994 RepID=A0ABW1A9N0_9ACTN|nr:hypothetical protein GCM10010200_020770 [Actinomadura rugatobispora]
MYQVKGLRSLIRTAIVALVIGYPGLIMPANAEMRGSPACHPALVGLELPSEKVHSGAAAQGKVRLDCASRRAVTVALASADPTWVSVPHSVTVPAGATEATVPIGTHQPDYIYGPFNVAVTATLHGQELSRPLELQPGLKFLSTSSSVISGDAVWLDVGLNGTAPEGGITITLESDNDALQLPTSITIKSGTLGTAGSFGRTVRIPQDANVTVTAKLPGQNRSSVIALRAWTYDPGDWSLTGPQEMYGSGAYGMTLNLPNPVPHGGVEVTFSSDNPRLDLPSSRTLNEGVGGTLNFQFSAPYDIDGNATVTADIEGVGSRSFNVRVRPGIKDVEIPWPLYGGQTFQGTIHLGTTTDVPLTIKLSSDNQVLQVPAEVVVPAGSASAVFTGTTAAVDAFDFATLTAQLDRSRLDRDVFIDPPPS